MNFQANIWSRAVKIITVAAAILTIATSFGAYFFQKPWGSLRNAALAVAMVGLAHGMWESYCESGAAKDRQLAVLFLVSAAVCVICSADLI